MVAAIKASRGLVSAAAKILECQERTIRRWVQDYPEVEQAMFEARESTLDMAEAALIGAINDKAAWAVCFYLKTQGKGRGYQENVRTELTGADGKPIEVAAAGARERVIGKLARIADRRQERVDSEPVPK